ncbi:hypothetical protein CJF31_00007144 [Rutstroemia sp. NJR-2017a BVV2]|nr:hypothetical protein CJF31_00007144 [Rutstroemia sp. NJR-2017a BVV2]
MVISKLELNRNFLQPLNPQDSGSETLKGNEQELPCSAQIHPWRRPSLPETDPGLMEDLFSTSDSELSSDDDPFAYDASSSTSSYQTKSQEEDVWNRYFQAPERAPPPPPHTSLPPPPHTPLPQHAYTFFPRPSHTPSQSNEYSHHPTHRSWPQQPWPERFDSRPDRRPRAQTIPSRPNPSTCNLGTYPFPGMRTPSSDHPFSHCDSFTPLIPKSGFETDSDDEEDENHPSKMAKAIEEMFEKFRLRSTEEKEKPRRARGGFRRSASEALKGVFGGKKSVARCDGAGRGHS